MASPLTTTPDTLINLRVNHDGITKKLKLALRDLGASTLEDKLRAHLAIAPGTESFIERYSDSAASYVVLDPSNVSVYKQLYRAAKAKQKLKLRVTTKLVEIEEECKTVPKPVTVEDVPEGLEAAEPKDVEETEKPAESPSPSTTPAPAPATDRPLPYLRVQLNNMPRNHEGLEKNIARNQEELEKSIAQLEASVAEMTKKSSPSGSCAGLSQLPQPHTETTTAGKIRANFAVHCNSCDRHIPDVHYHCSTCDDGDFDLCQDCVDMGITCYGTGHWLIKRFVTNGIIISSTTEKIAPKVKAQAEPAPEDRPRPAPTRTVPIMALGSVLNASVSVRTCNNCVRELPDPQFIHCTTCLDFDLCSDCFAQNEHGHHPKHAFVPAVVGAALEPGVVRRLAPGRGQKHNAICDGCDKFIAGVRHKCLDCPDWDYCASCVVNAGFVHPNHRFVPIYEPIAEIRPSVAMARATHYGICCDGPLCNSTRGGNATYIVGDRYKCAVCHDTDFCANCEASPANAHNKTHPLIKFKTPVRRCSVTTTGDRPDGRRMPIMGDRVRPSVSSSQSRATEATQTNPDMSLNQAQTVVDIKPTEPAPPVEDGVKEIKQEETEPEKPAAETKPSVDELVAHYASDTIADGTVLPPNHVFQQTWVLRNAGTVPWPAGCSVKFVSGDYMGHVDHSHPAGIRELVSASESTMCGEPIVPGEEFPFTVLLRTPSRVGKVISYWRLTTKDGLKFGHRLWCDVDVQAPKPKEEPKQEVDSSPQSEASQMVFPKLEKESPEASIHEEAKSETVAAEAEEEADEFEDCEDDEWAEGNSDDGFLTDEEYDILDASDEEYLDGQQKQLLKK